MIESHGSAYVRFSPHLSKMSLGKFDRDKKNVDPTRRKLLSASAGIAIWPLAGRAAAGDPVRFYDPPTFSSNTGQFTLESPLRSIGPISIRDLESRPMEIGGLRQRPQLISFWASWCLPCRNELPMLQRLHRAYPNLVDLLAVSIDSTAPESVRQFLRKLGITDLPIAHDQHAEIWEEAQDARGAPFVIYGMPISFLLDKEGRLTGYITGDADWTSPEGLALLTYFAHESRV